MSPVEQLALSIVDDRISVAALENFTGQKIRKAVGSLSIDEAVALAPKAFASEIRGAFIWAAIASFGVDPAEIADAADAIGELASTPIGRWHLEDIARRLAEKSAAKLAGL